MLNFCANTSAQNPYIRHFTSLNGLPSNTIYQIYQDSHKFLWFTSDAGVIKFDGFNFISYRKKDGLSSNDVVRIKEDSKGRIWLFNYNGSVNYIFNNKIYNGKNAPFLNLLTGKGFILDFFTDSNHTLYFYTWQREVFTLDTNNKVSRDSLFKRTSSEPFFIRKSAEPLFIRKYDQLLKVSCLSKSPSDEWIIWSSIGLFRQDCSQNKGIAIIDSSLHCMAVFPGRNNISYVKTYYNELLKITGDYRREKIPFPCDLLKINTIIEDSEGYLWIAANDEGVFCLKNNIIVKHFDLKDALGLLQDHEQNIWVSTQSDGVYMISHDVLKQTHFDCTYFENYGVDQLCNVPGFGILCANTNVAFLMKNNAFYKLPVPEVVRPINIVCPFNNRTLLLGSISKKLCAFENLKLDVASKEIGYSRRVMYPIPVKKIIADLSGYAAAMYNQNQIYPPILVKFSSLSEFNLKSERINNAFYNANNELVVNAKRNYLCRNNKQLPYPELSRFDGTIITDHLVLYDSIELFTIDGDSLFILKNHRFYNLTNAFDIPVDVQINKILYVDSTLYLTTLRDVFVCNNPMNVLSGNPVHLEPLNISFNNINDVLIHNDTLFVASNDGLTSIAKASFTTSVASPPIPYLISISINEKIIYSRSDKELKLTGKKTVKLSFGCISYSASPVFYSYKLEGTDKKWTIGTGSSINLLFQDLPRGHYVFKLRVRKSNSNWSKPLELVITIKPTLVEYPAFWLFIMFIAGGFITFVIFSIRTQKIKKVEIDHQLIVMEQKALQSMMNPHFIFNSLGSIQNYLLTNKGSEAVIYLSQFARLIRQNLHAINKPMIALEDEIDRLRNYIDLEQKRLENKFDYSIEIDTQLEEEGLFIPSMIIQPIAENSIWHGIAMLEEKGIIKIGFRVHTAKSIRVIIEDNGIGLKKSLEYTAKSSQHEHLGMQIIKKRLDLLSKKYKTKTSILYSESSSNHTEPGVMVEIILPFVYRIDDF